MGVLIQPYNDNPILMVTFSGKPDLSELQRMYQESAAFCYASNFPMVWRLINVEQADITFADVIQAFKLIDCSQPGAISDTQIHSLFTAPHPMARLISDMLAQDQFGNIFVPVLPGLGEALLYVQDEIKNYR